MTKEYKIQNLNKVLEESKALSTEDWYKPVIYEWKNWALFILEEVFGKNSPKVKEFNKLLFYSPTNTTDLHFGRGPSQREIVNNDFETAKRLIKRHLDQMEGKIPIESDENNLPESQSKKDLPKILWKADEAQLVKLFLELKRRKWIDEPIAEAIANSFTPTKLSTIESYLRKSVYQSESQPLGKKQLKAFDKIEDNKKVSKKKVKY